MHKETTAVEQETARSKNKTTSPNMRLSGLVPRSEEEDGAGTPPEHEPHNYTNSISP